MKSLSFCQIITAFRPQPQGDIRICHGSSDNEKVMNCSDKNTSNSTISSFDGPIVCVNRSLAFHKASTEVLKGVCQ